MKREKWDWETELQNDMTEIDLTGMELGLDSDEYSLEQILSEFSGVRESEAVETEQEIGSILSEPEGFEDAFPNTEVILQTENEISLSEDLEAESKPETAERKKNTKQDEPVEAIPENMDSVPADSVKEERVTRPRWIRRKNRQKVMEEFPDSPQEPDVGTEDPIDYTLMFRMFAEPKPEETSQESDVKKEKRTDTGRSEQKGTEGRTETTQAAPEKSRKQVPETEPLLAENPLDFRDILREFMLGDQHPIYADMPGIGKKADQPAAQEAEPDDLEAVLNDVLKRSMSAPRQENVSRKPGVKEQRTETEETEAKKQAPEPEKTERPWRRTARIRRSYTVEEDFPPEATPVEETAAQKPEETDLVPQDFLPNENRDEKGTVIPSETDAEDQQTEEPDHPDGKLRKLLHGFGEKKRNSGKRALNEPKAYASFEDYVPKEEKPEEKKQETPKEAGKDEPLTNATEEQTVQEKTSAEEEEDDEILYSGDFPSFGQWILNELMTVWIRINGIGDRASTATMEDDAEDLGKEVNVANASRYYGSQVTMLRMRFQIGIVLLVILAYITLGLPVSGMLKTAKVAAAMCLGLQLTVMLLCLDVVTNAAVNLGRRKFGADALAVLACVISSLDALNVAVGGFGNPHIPLCLFSSLSLMGILLSALLSSRALRKSTRVPAIGKRVYCVTAEEGVRGGGDLTLLKSVRPTAGFVRRAEEAPPDESLFIRHAPVMLLAALVLSLLTAVVKHSIGDYLYVLSAILSCAVPVTALLAFALPFFIGSERIFSSGAAVAGWSGIHDIGCSRNLIVTDRDLFPEETISIESVRIFADDSAERVIGFAGSMIAASGSGLAPCFAELMEKNNCRMRQVEDFQWLSGGGLQGRIEGSTVLCGNSDLMQLMNVKVPYRLVDRTTVLLAINGVLYGIFKINYVGLPEIRTALQELIASNRHPIFAIRDFNITPDMLHEVFDVATDGYDFPPYGDRFRISEAKPSETSKISAVVCREGLGPLTHLADTGRSMYVAIRLNLIITAAVALIGMLLVFFKLIITGEVSAWLPFVLMLLDAIIVALISLFMRF